MFPAEMNFGSFKGFMKEKDKDGGYLWQALTYPAPGVSGYVVSPCTAT